MFGRHCTNREAVRELKRDFAAVCLFTARKVREVGITMPNFLT